MLNGTLAEHGKNENGHPLVLPLPIPALSELLFSELGRLAKAERNLFYATGHLSELEPISCCRGTKSNLQLSD